MVFLTFGVQEDLLHVVEVVFLFVNLNLQYTVHPNSILS